MRFGRKIQKLFSFPQYKPKKPTESNPLLFKNEQKFLDPLNSPALDSHDGGHFLPGQSKKWQKNKPSHRKFCEKAARYWKFTFAWYDNDPTSAASRIFIQYRSPDEAKRLCILRYDWKHLPSLGLRRRWYSGIPAGQREGGNYMTYNNIKKRGFGEEGIDVKGQFSFSFFTEFSLREHIYCGLSYVGRYQFLYPIWKNASDKLGSCLSRRTCLLSFYSSKECITLTMVNPQSTKKLFFFRIDFSFRYCIICGMPKTMHFLSIACYYIVRNIIKINRRIIKCKKLTVLL